MPAPRKKKEPIPLLVPDADSRVRRWVILGLDPSMTRTGFALLDVRPALAHTPAEDPYTDASWLAAGSLKPEAPKGLAMHSRNTLWQRSKAMAIYLRETVKTVAPPKGDTGPDVGLIISMEYPTPQNDFLVALNRIINLIFFEDGVLAERFGEIRIMLNNASTMRSLMGLYQRGSKNKAENIRRAYDFIDRVGFPELDSDACDAVLMAIMARHAASVMLGVADEVPDNFLNAYCSAAQETKGKGRNARTVIRGLLHRIEYWYKYERKSFTVCVKDASNPKKSLSRIDFSI